MLEIEYRVWLEKWNELNKVSIILFSHKIKIKISIIRNYWLNSDLCGWWVTIGTFFCKNLCFCFPVFKEWQKKSLCSGPMWLMKGVKVDISRNQTGNSYINYGPMVNFLNDSYHLTLFNLYLGIILWILCELYYTARLNTVPKFTERRKGMAFIAQLN